MIKSEMSDMNRTDKVANILINMRGMIGAVKYLMNPEGERLGCPEVYFEDWFSEIGDRLDEVIELL